MALHLAALGWIAGCSTAAWWQISRATDGNSISWVYAVEWPVFAVAGVFGWWSFLHADAVSDEQRAERRAFEEQMRSEARIARQVDHDEDDPTLRAYNDHLEAIGAQPKRRLFGH